MSTGPASSGWALRCSPSRRGRRCYGRSTGCSGRFRWQYYWCSCTRTPVGCMCRMTASSPQPLYDGLYGGLQEGRLIANQDHYRLRNRQMLIRVYMHTVLLAARATGHREEPKLYFAFVPYMLLAVVARPSKSQPTAQSTPECHDRRVSAQFAHHQSRDLRHGISADPARPRRLRGPRQSGVVDASTGRPALRSGPLSP